MRIAALALLASLTLRAGWIETRYGPYIVFSDTGDKDARAAMYQLEQFRFIFGEAIGKQDLKSVWPITVVVTKLGANAAAAPGFSRDGWIAAWPAGSTPSADWFRRLAVIFMEDNLTGRMSGDLEPSMASLFSTMQFQGGKVTLGVPPPAEQRTKHWGLFQYLMTNPETAVRTKVLLANLAAGGDEEAAYRNAFEKPKADVDADVERYLQAGQFRTVTIAGRPMDPDLLFHIIQMLPSRVRVLAGDRMLGAGGSAAEVRAAYQKAQDDRPGPLGFEGLALALLAEKKTAEARSALEQMAKDAEGGARGLYELGLMEQGDEARKLLERAATVNPRWAAPFARLAELEPGPIRKAALYKKASELAPRHAAYLREMAKAQFDGKKFEEADRSWRAAERVAANDTERAELTQAREQFEAQRYDAQAAERARQKKEEQDEVERVRQQAMANIRKAEDAANAGHQPPAKKVEKWWDGPPEQTFSGTLESVACQGGRARLMVRDPDGKRATFLISDPGKVVITGSGQAQVQLSCGTQKPPRRVKIEYAAQTGAAGSPPEVVSVEFQ